MKKILENEINEVVGIFEKVGVEMIQVDSKTDKEVENIQINDKAEIVNDKNRIHRDKIKSRFKKIETVEKKDKKNLEDNKVVLTYEKFYVQEAEKKIESIINVDAPQLGINEIASKVIGSVIENDEKIKKAKKIEKMNQELIEKKKFERENEKMKKRLLSFRFILPRKIDNTPRNDRINKMRSSQGFSKLNLNHFKNIEDKLQTPKAPNIFKIKSYQINDKEKPIQ